MRRHVALALLAVLALASLARADWILLRNGSHWRGTVEERRDGKLRIRLENGEVTIREDQVLGIEPEMSFDARLQEGNRRLLATPPDYAGAKRAYWICKKEFDQHASANLGYILALTGLGETDDAMKLSRLMVALYPTHARVRIAHAELLSLAGEFRQAEAHLKEAAALQPQDAAVQQLVAAGQARNMERAAQPRPARGQPVAGQPATAPAELDSAASGNNIEARRTASELLAWLRNPGETHRQTFRTSEVTLTPEVRREEQLAQPGVLEQYRAQATAMEIKVKVDEEPWLKIEPVMATWAKAGKDENLRERRLTLMGLFYQLRARYPKAAITVTVWAERRNQRQPVRIALARWNDTFQKLDCEFDSQ